jgi:hypothetical protein
MAFPGIATTVVLIVPASFIDGFVCKQVAGFWEEESEDIPEAVEAEWEDKNL